MTEPVHILVTCRKQELLPAATLVFKTLRVGFPDAPVHVYSLPGNCCEEETALAASTVDAELHSGAPAWQHDGWIRNRIATQYEPFWICDTDLVFWKEFFHAPDGHALAGVKTPSFSEPFTGSRYRERLHTCLMRIDPIEFKTCVREYLESFPKEPFRPRFDPVHQQWQPERVNGNVIHHFYDTLAMAWHAFGGQEFTPDQLRMFSHLNCATYVDLVAPSLDFDIMKAHKAIYKDPSKARGSWDLQFKWFAAHKVQA